MGIDATIIGRSTGGGTKRQIMTEDGAVLVSVLPHTDFFIDDPRRPFRQFITDDGKSTGSHDMLVDGSTTGQEFSILAKSDRHIVINFIYFLIVEAGIKAGRKWGAGNALTNGMKFEYSTGSDLTVISETLTSNFEFVRMCMNYEVFGQDDKVLIMKDIVGVAEGLTPILNVSNYVPGGLRLHAGSREALIITVRDNLIGTVDQFEAFGIGYEVMV